MHLPLANWPAGARSSPAHLTNTRNSTLSRALPTDGASRFPCSLQVQQMRDPCVMIWSENTTRPLDDWSGMVRLASQFPNPETPELRLMISTLAHTAESMDRAGGIFLKKMDASAVEIDRELHYHFGKIGERVWENPAVAEAFRSPESCIIPISTLGKSVVQSAVEALAGINFVINRLVGHHLFSSVEGVKVVKAAVETFLSDEEGDLGQALRFVAAMLNCHATDVIVQVRRGFLEDIGLLCNSKAFQIAIEQGQKDFGVDLTHLLQDLDRHMSLNNPREFSLGVVPGTYPNISPAMCEKIVDIYAAQVGKAARR